MIKEWATVVSWQQGIAVVRYDRKTGCCNCNAGFDCSIPTLNELVPQNEHPLQIPNHQLLKPGQRVEVGIAEGALLRSAMLVYMMPLLGMMLGGILLQYWLGTDAFAALGTLLGGGVAFILVRSLVYRLGKQSKYQPIILQIGIPPGAIDAQAENSRLI